MLGSLACSSYSIVTADLLLEVKDDTWAQRAELRYGADVHMRQRYDTP
jgi:hypothetical protein